MKRAERPVNFTSSFSDLNALADAVILNSPVSSQEESLSPTKQSSIARRKLFPSLPHYLDGKVSPHHVAIRDKVGEIHFVIKLNEALPVACAITRFVLKSDEVFEIGGGAAVYGWQVTSSTVIHKGMEWHCVASLGGDTDAILSWVAQNRLVLVSAVVMTDENKPKIEVLPHRMHMKNLQISF
jgi:hypothetical protein